MFIFLRNLGFILVSISLLAGCSTNQTVKNAWKATKGTWYTYVNKPAVVDYDETGNLDAYESSLATRMIGIDVQWQSLERVMSNADRPPNSEWVSALFAKFPWLDGFAGVNAEGKIVGKAGNDLNLDYSPLLEADKKQNIHALRGLVEEGSSGAEILLATPLYKDAEFLGIVVAYFSMKSLMSYCTNPEEIIVLSPQAVLWPGKYSVESTALAKVKWDEVLTRSSHGTVSDGQGAFFWMNRYLGNQPVVFAVEINKKQPEKEERLAAVAASMDRSSPMPLLTAPLLTPAEQAKAKEAAEQQAKAQAQAEAEARQAQAQMEAQMRAQAEAQARAAQARMRAQIQQDEIRAMQQELEFAIPASRSKGREIETPSPIHRAPADDRGSVESVPDAPSAPPERLSPIHRAPDRAAPPSAANQAPGREVSPAPKTDADIDVGSSRSVLRPPSPIHAAPKGKVPETNLPESPEAGKAE